MKRILPVVVILSITLAACSLQASTPTTSDSLIQTAVAQALTAYPTQTPMIVIQTAMPETSIPSLPESTPVSPSNTPLPSSPSIIIVYSTVMVYPSPTPTCIPSYADQFICYYYQKINARDYITTWSLLTDAFKAIMNPESSGGYTGYVNFWNTVQKVDILSTTITSISGNYATVWVNMVYYYVNGTVSNSALTFHLFYDSLRATWMFDAASASTPVPTATTFTPTPNATTLTPTSTIFPSTPTSFIYYYFNNINARNYTITWALLSNSFIARNNPPESGGFTGYVNFWNTVSYVEITYVTVNSVSSSNADVTIGMTLHYTSGLVTNSNVLYHLIFNYTIGSWQFN